MQNDPEYINRLMLLPEMEREAKMNGDWFSFAGAVFQELRITRNPGEPENALHVIPPFLIPNYWPRLLAIDWGWSAWTFAIWGAVSPTGRIYIYRTYRVKKTNISHWAADLARLSQGEKIVRVALDPSAWQQRGYELTIAELFQKHSGMIPEKADNDRHSGVSLIHEYLRFNPKPPKRTPEEGYNRELAERLLRVQGLEAHNQYLDLFKSEPPETEIPKLQFFQGFTEDLLSALQAAQFDEKDKEDYADFDGDDPIDCLRYLLKASSVYLETTNRLSEFLKEEGRIHKALEESGDMTSFYMRMQMLDHKREGLVPKAVKRIH
jgi:hypothetical protein